MKKRIFSFLLLVVVLATALLVSTSCDKNGRVSSALKKTAKLKDVDADVDTTFTINEIKYARLTNVRRDGENKDKPLIRIGTTISAKNTSSKTTKVFMDNDTVYVPEKDNTGYTVNRAKYSSENPSLEELYYSLIKDLPDSVYDYAVSKKKKGDTYLTLTASLTKEDFALAYSDYMNGIRKSAREQLGAENIRFNTCHLVIKVREGYVNELSISYDMIAFIGGTDKTVSVSTVVKLNDLKKDVDIKLPVNRDNYAKK